MAKTSAVLSAPERKRKRSSSITVHASDGGQDGQDRPTKESKLKPLVKARKHSSPVTFPFLSLPPELRNRIYELALVDSDGACIASRMKKERRVARHSRSLAVSTSESRHDRMTPVLLVTCKQVCREATAYLYNQDLKFENQYALQSFLAMISPIKQRHLRKVTIESSTGGGSESSALTMLPEATGLDSLRLNYEVGQCSNMEKLALHVWRALHFWFAAYGRANGRKDAGVDIVEMSSLNFAVWDTHSHSYDRKKGKAKEVEFVSQLRKLVNAG